MARRWNWALGVLVVLYLLTVVPFLLTVALPCAAGLLAGSAGAKAPEKPVTAEAQPAASQGAAAREDLVSRQGDATVAADQTVKGDVVTLNGNALVHGKVTGNVVAVNGSIHLYDGASVAGDCVALGGQVIRDPKAQAAGSKVQVTAPWAAGLLTTEAKTEPKPPAEAKHEIEGIVKFGQPVQVEAGQVVNDDVVAIGGPITMLGTVNGDVVSVGGPVEVSGEVNGDVVSVGGAVHLKAGARVNGDVAAVGGTVTRDEGAVINGQQVGLGLGRLVGPMAAPLLGAGSWLFGGLMQFILVLLALAIVPRNIEAIATGVAREPGQAAAYGIVGLMLCLPILVLLAVLVVTLVAVPLYLAAVAGLFWLGGAAMCVVVGRLVAPRFGWSPESVFVIALIGFGALRLVHALSLLPHVAPLADIAMLAVMVLGFGGALMTWFGSDPTGTWWARRGSRPPVAPVSVSPSPEAMAPAAVVVPPSPEAVPPPPASPHQP
jgi:hypothetical protein